MSQEKQPTPQETFEQRMIERMRKDIGDLMPDEALKGALEKAMNKMFFDPIKRTEGSGYHQRVVEGPSWLEDEVTKLLSERMDKALATYFAENKERVDQVIAEAVKASSMKAVADTIDRMLTNTIMGAIGNEVSNRLQQYGIKTY